MMLQQPEEDYCQALTELGWQVLEDLDRVSSFFWWTISNSRLAPFATWSEISCP
jgi:hypothetical protein